PGRGTVIMAALSKPREAFLKKFIWLTTISMPIMRTWAIADCKTTNALRKEIPPTILEVILLFKAVIGLNPDKITEGYSPDKNVTSIATTITNKTSQGSKMKFILILISSNLLRNGNADSATTTAIITAAIVINAVSPRNCKAS